MAANVRRPVGVRPCVGVSDAELVLKREAEREKEAERHEKEAEPRAQLALNKVVNKQIEPEMQEEASERSIIARGTDYLAMVPLIGSLFGLARIIGSAAVAAYYKWHENTKSNSTDMLLRALDEAIRGVEELLPCGGLMLALAQHGLEKTITLGAAGKFYCKHGEKLYYGNTPLKDKHIQWICTDQIAPHTRIYDTLMAEYNEWVKCKDTFSVQNQGRVIENEADKNGRLLTTVETEELEHLG